MFLEEEKKRIAITSIFDLIYLIKFKMDLAIENKKTVS